MGGWTNNMRGPGRVIPQDVVKVPVRRRADGDSPQIYDCPEKDRRVWFIEFTEAELTDIVNWCAENRPELLGLERVTSVLARCIAAVEAMPACAPIHDDTPAELVLVLRQHVIAILRAISFASA